MNDRPAAQFPLEVPPLDLHSSVAKHIPKISKYIFCTCVVYSEPTCWICTGRCCTGNVSELYNTEQRKHYNY